MAQIDDWLARAAGNIPADGLDATFSALEQRLGEELTPMAMAGRRDACRAMFCACFAAIAGFWAIGGADDIAQAKAQPTWIAAPSQSSPYSLLIGH
ncbi:CnrY/NccY family anti-sigma factor [Novosphingobium sediminicola]|uniref:Uncharacterized protein n=1 Tax=Novosphingobium sediminicola TaxID=563162 RepID=A0A7W6CMG9_9SPHN|nr:hypothetical protein [Novosphingobium sediminicola]